ncbi:MAG: thioredoxin [Actinomycetota bacterium]|nr:MAG: thioredoxin [Actinomycetota bacterium]
MIGVLALVAVLVIATAVGIWHRLNDGRIRGVAAGAPGSGPAESAASPVAATPDVLTERDLGAGLGSRATLVQFSTAFCAPCRAARRVLSEVSGMVDGVVHVEVDAESHLDLVRRLGVLRTPTVLVLGPGGRIARRAVGAPRKADVLAALGEVVP